MTPPDAAALRGRVARRYAPSGRFAFHYVTGKLKRDPLTEELLRGVPGGFGEVADLGCGRGQFAALLLEAGLARRVVGVERNPRLLGQASDAMRGMAFEAHAADLTTPVAIEAADTVLLLDVLYQLPSVSQRALLERVATAARRRVLIRTTDPRRGARAWLTQGLERASRRFWPHAGSVVNPRPIDELAAIMETAGFVVRVAPCWRATPFANVLIRAERYCRTADAGGAAGRAGA